MDLIYTGIVKSKNYQISEEIFFAKNAIFNDLTFDESEMIYSFVVDKKTFFTTQKNWQNISVGDLIEFENTGTKIKKLKIL